MQPGVLLLGFLFPLWPAIPIVNLNPVPLPQRKAGWYRTDRAGRISLDIKPQILLNDKCVIMLCVGGEKQRV